MTRNQLHNDINSRDVEAALNGEKLYGDDFEPAEIEQWFNDEGDASFVLAGATRGRYGYHSLNKWHGFERLPQIRYSKVLGLGSARGDELLPIAEQAAQITIVESAEGYRHTELAGKPVTYAALNQAVISELSRVIRTGGYALIREPIVSMGDWRYPRDGLTKRERGLPFNIFRQILINAGFQVMHERKCAFSLTPKFGRYLSRGQPVYNCRSIVVFDDLICRLGLWSESYHAVSWWQKLRPTSAFFTLRKY